MNTFGPPQLVLTRGKGAHVWDEDGNEYVDLLGGIAVNALGHAHPAVVEAVTRQLSTLGHVSNFFATEPQITLAERLLDLARPPAGRGGRSPGIRLGTASGKVFFTNSGAEANEAALKLTRRTGRTHLVAAEGSFHGRTMGALALTSKAAYREPFEPLPGPRHLRAVRRLRGAGGGRHRRDGGGGARADPGRGRRRRSPPTATSPTPAGSPASTAPCCGWTRCRPASGGPAPGSRPRPTRSVAPDVVTLAKGLGGGIPIGACLGLGAAGDLLQPGHHGTTFGGNPVACAAALAVLDTIEDEGLLARATRARATGCATGLADDPRVTEVRGRGLLIGLDVAVDAPSVVAAARAPRVHRQRDRSAHGASGPAPRPRRR